MTKARTQPRKSNMAKGKKKPPPPAMPNKGPIKKGC